MAKAVAALNPQLFQHMNFQKEKDYYKVYMHINRNVFAEYQKMKKLNESEESDNVSEFTWKAYKPPSTNAETSQDSRLTPWKHKFKWDLAKKKQHLSKSKKLLLEKRKDLEHMKNQLEIRQAFMKLLEKGNEKEHS